MDSYRECGNMPAPRGIMVTLVGFVGQRGGADVPLGGEPVLDGLCACRHVILAAVSLHDTRRRNL
jgi:hypothetical protein